MKCMPILSMAATSQLEVSLHKWCPFTIGLRRKTAEQWEDYGVNNWETML